MIATDPPVSEKQRRAMYAALHGKSTLGIPRSVAEKYVGEGHDTAADMSRVDWRGLLRGLTKFLREESREPEHQAALDALTRDAAGIAFVDPDGKALFVKRKNADGDHDGEWGFPGGWREGDEEPADTARREAIEEAGKAAEVTDELGLVSRVVSPEGVRYSTFYQPVSGPFGVELSEESYEHQWAPLEEPPEPLHPEVKSLLGTLAATDATLAAPAVAKTGLHDKVKIALKQPLLSYTARQLDVDPSPKVPEKRTGGEGVAGDVLDPLLKEARVAELHGRGDLARRADAKITALFAADAKFEEIEQAVRGKASDPEALAAWIRRRQLGPAEMARKAAAGRAKDHIEKANSGYQLLSHTGKNLGTYPSKGGAEKRERQVEYFKHKGGDNQPALATAPNAGIPLIVVRALRGGKPTRIKFAKSVAARDKKTALDRALALDWCQEVGLKRVPIVIVAAFDKDSLRRYDVDGHLHVDESNISRACVSRYRGEEIPDHERLGLDPGKIYKLLRDPEELKRAASSSNGKPILWSHKATEAADHATDLVIGSVGDEARYVHPWLKNKLHFWPAYASKAIESGDQSALSCGYRYVADMTPGVYDGEAFDGVMRDLQFNHLALVENGRVAGAIVADGQIDSGWHRIEDAIRRGGKPRWDN